MSAPSCTGTARACSSHSAIGRSRLGSASWWRAEMVAVASIVGGALAAGGSVLGGSIAASGSRQAADLSRLVAQLTAQRLDPFRGAGENAGNMLSADLSSGRLGQPAPLITAAIEDMPGYRFVREDRKSTRLHS